MVIDPMVKEQFYIGALAIAKEQGMVWADLIDHHDDYLNRLVEKWGGQKELARYESIDKALIDFRNKLIAGKNKLEERFKAEERQISIDRISVTLHVPIGMDRTVDFTASGAIPVPSTSDELKYFHARLFQAAFQGWAEFKANPPAQLLPNKPAYQNTDDTVVKQFEFHSIVVEIRKGERYYKVKGDEFSKYGVIVYPEVLARAGIQPDKIEDEAFLVGTAAYVLKPDGTPQKVVQILSFSGSL